MLPIAIAPPPPPRAAVSVCTLADLLRKLGGVSPERVRANPPPGTATLEDVVEIHLREDRLYELVAGTLVEKAMGFPESALACALIRILGTFIVERNLGLVSGADGMLRLFPGLVRIPDLAFVSWQRVPNGRMPEEPVPALVPDLAVEVLSPSNTREEMALKRGEYFDAGVRLVWEINPRTRTVAVYTGAEQFNTLAEFQTLDGGDVLPGFALPLRELFAELDRQANS